MARKQLVQIIFVKLRTHKLKHFNLGLTRIEWVWVVGLLIALYLLIVSTSQAEIEKGKARICKDTLSYLSARLHISLEKQGYLDGSELPEFLFGPGELPAFITRAKAPLKHLDNSLFIPQDPWGRAYILHTKKQEGEKHKLLILSAGPSGEYPSLTSDKDSTSFIKEVSIPYFNQ